MWIPPKKRDCNLEPELSRLRSQQKPRFLLAETKPMSEKGPQATFSD
jgi:hypothetical protein